MSNDLEEIRKEINDMWEKELKDNAKKQIDSFLETEYKKYDKKIKDFTEEINDKMNQTTNLLKIEKVLEKKKTSQNLVNIKDSNSLINPILICLSNIKPLVYFCLSLKDSNILKKINEKNKDNFISSFVNLINSLWIENKEYEPIEIHFILKQLMNEDYESPDPGLIISFILSKLSEELNYEKKNNIQNININDYKLNEVNKYYDDFYKNNKNEISDIFFINYKITKKCPACKLEKSCYEQKPIVNLYIEELRKSISEQFNRNKSNLELSLKENLLFLLNNDSEDNYIKEECMICSKEKEFKINNYIENINNKILIINLNREQDPRHSTCFDYEEKIKFKDFNNVEYELICVLIQKLNNNENILVYFKSFIDKKWYLYQNEQMIQQNNKSMFNQYDAQILIYQKV